MPVTVCAPGRSAGEGLEHCVDRPIERRPARDQNERIEISLHRHAALDVLARKGAVEHPVEPDSVDRYLVHIARQQRPGAAGKSDDLRPRHLGADPGDDLPRRLDAPTVEFLSRQDAGPGVKNLHCIGTRPQLAHQVARRSLDENIEQHREPCGVAIGKQPRWRLVRRATASDHIARHSPWAAAKSKKGDAGVEVFLHDANRFIDRRKDIMIDLSGQALKAAPVFDRIELRTFTCGKAHLLAERVRDDQNVREQDRGIEAKPPHRLKRDFGREFRREHEVEEASRFSPYCTIFRQIPPSLPHQPDWRRVMPTAIKDVKERLVHRMPAEMLFQSKIRRFFLLWLFDG